MEPESQNRQNGMGTELRVERRAIHVGVRPSPWAFLATQR
jgi:hypothetical protein